MHVIYMLAVVMATTREERNRPPKTSARHLEQEDELQMGKVGLHEVSYGHPVG